MQGAIGLYLYSSVAGPSELLIQPLALSVNFILPFWPADTLGFHRILLFLLRKGLFPVASSKLLTRVDMGLKTYFKPSPRSAPRNPPIVSEKASTNIGDAFETNALPASKFPSSRASLALSTNSSTYVDEIKHEVIVNYLYQQQCSHLWVHEASGELEGVLPRKSRDSYMVCPSQLTRSAIGLACAALNLQVRYSF